MIRKQHPFKLVIALLVMSSCFLSTRFLPSAVIPSERCINDVEASHGPPSPEIHNAKEKPFLMPAPYNNVTHDIFWLHIQKTGTSFWNTVLLNLCPRVLREHPEINDHPERFKTRLEHGFPPDDWCDARVLNTPAHGKHHPYKPPRPGGRPFYTFTMFREPMTRLRSSYAFGRHHSKWTEFVPAENVTFPMYLNEALHHNCQTKMMTGHSCKVYVPQSLLNVTLAIDRLEGPNFFFGLTERWEESICLFHASFGGDGLPIELGNNRPTRKKKPQVPPKNEVNHVDLDWILFEAAEALFERRVARAGCAATQNTSDFSAQS